MELAEHIKWLRGWFFKTKKSCKHFKKFGEPHPKNMIRLFRFTPYKNDTIGFGVHECSECGKRAFSSMGAHLLCDELSQTIDMFISYKIGVRELFDFMKTNNVIILTKANALLTELGEK